MSVPVGGFVYSGSIVDMVPVNVASDFGRRASNSLWHVGVDVSTQGGDDDVGDRIYPVETGTIYRVKGTGDYKVVVIEGNHRFGYGHIFYNEEPNSTQGSRSGDFILKHMESPHDQFFAIIYAPQGGNAVAFGEVSGTVKHPDVNNNQPINVLTAVTSTLVPIAPVGNSGNASGAAHVHLYNFENNPIDNDFNSSYLSSGGYSSTYFRNQKNPLEFLQHNSPNYLLSFPQGINFTYPGTSQSSIKVRATMSNENPGSNYSNSIMDIENVKLYIKKSYLPFSDFRLIKGSNLESQIVYGGKLNSERYPSFGFPPHNVGVNAIDIAKGKNSSGVDEGIGSNNRSGMVPFAYNTQPYDEFYFSDIYTRIHKNNVFGSTSTTFASINEECLYSDGTYDLFVQLMTAGDNYSNGIIQQITIDNFRPYVKEVQVRRFGAGGELAYYGNWEWIGGALVLNNYTGSDIPAFETVWIKLVASEPMTNLEINIESVDGSVLFNPLDVVPNSDNKEFIISYPAINALGTQTIRIKGTDFSGNPLQSNPSQIPLRQNNNQWIPTPGTTGIDLSHHFNIGSNVCSDVNNGGRVRSKAKVQVESECLYANYSVNNLYPLLNESVVFSPVVSGGALTYNWNFGANAIPATSTTSGPQAVIYTSPGTKTISLKICDLNGDCVTEQKVDFISVLSSNMSNLAVDFSVDRYAANVNEQFQLTSMVTGSSGSVSYNWDFGEGGAGNVTAANPTVAYSTPGNKTISLTVYDATTNVTQTRNSWLYVNSPFWNIQPSIGGCGTTNGVGNITFISNVTGGDGPPYDSYLWDFGDGKTSTSSSSIVSHQYAKAGKYTVRLTVCDETSCGTAENVPCVIVPSSVDNSTLNPNFLINNLAPLSPPLKVGLNTPVSFVNSTTGGGNPSTFSYYWDFDSHYYGSSVGSGVPSTAQSTGPVAQQVYYSKIGRREISLTVTNSSTSNRKTVQNALEVVSGLGSGTCYATIGNVTVSSNCWDSNNPPKFTIPVESSNCPIASYIEVIHWISPGQGIPVTNGVLDFSLHNEIPEFPFTSEFSFSVFQYDGVSYNRIGYKRQQFTFYGPISASAGPDIQVCLGSTSSIGSSSVEGMMYQWATTNGAPLAYLSSTTVSNPTFNGVQKGTFKYKVTATNMSTGCSASDEITVTVDRPNLNSLSVQYFAKLAEPLPIGISASGGFGNLSYNWTPATYLSSSIVASPDFSTTQEGDYTYVVEAKDGIGCSGTTQVYVNVSSAPANLVAEAKSYQRIHLSWMDRANNENGFVIQRSVNDDQNFIDYATVGSNVTQFDDVQVSQSDTYYYRVAVIILGNPAGLTNVSSSKTGDLPLFSSIPVPGFIVACGDLDNDGTMEFIVDNGSLNIYKIGQNENFTLWKNFAISPDVVLVVDIDDDNDLDIATSTSTGIVLLVNNQGNFVQNQIGTDHSTEINFIDSRNINRVDLFTSRGYNGATTPPRIYRNNLNLNFTVEETPFHYWYYGPGYAFGPQVAVADFDGDGDQDVISLDVSGGYPYKMLLRYNDGGNFMTSEEVDANPLTVLGAADYSDFNSDGKIDFALTNNGLKLFKNLGDGSFQRNDLWSNAFDKEAVRFGDFDADGDQDLLASENNAIKVFENIEGDLVFKLGLGGANADWFDLDNDGDLDISRNGLSIYRNNAGLSLFRPNTPPTPPSNLCLYFNGNEAIFTWSPGTDAETPSSGLTYNLYVKQNGQFVYSPMANIQTGFRKIVRKGNVDQNTSWRFTLPGTGPIEWGVQSIDTQGIGSAFATNLVLPEQTICGTISTSTSIFGRIF